MTNEEMQKFSNDLQEKLGENKNLILDDLAKLITDTQIMNSTIKNKEDEIEKLKERNTNLVNTNASLFQQVGFSNTEDNKPKEKPKTTKVSFRDCFDEKGNFKK